MLLFLDFPVEHYFYYSVCFLSHLIVDTFSVITYHTPEAQKGDKFWLIWHYFIYAISLFSIVIFFIPYWLSMLFANIMASKIVSLLQKPLKGGIPAREKAPITLTMKVMGIAFRSPPNLLSSRV